MFEMIGGGERAGSGADTIKKGWADNKWPAPAIKEHFNGSREYRNHKDLSPQDGYGTTTNC